VSGNFSGSSRAMENVALANIIAAIKQIVEAAGVLLDVTLDGDVCISPS